MSATSGGTNKIWPNWWRWGGVDGIIWAVLFVIGAVVLQGEPPARDDSAEVIRDYFEDGQMWLIGDYLIALGFIFFFLPYVIALRWVLGTGEGWPPIWSWMSFAGGLGVVFVGACSGFLWGGLALGLEDNPDLDAGTLRFLMDATSYANYLWTMFVALFVGSSGFVILRSGVLWRWLGAVGILAAVLLIIGAAWIIDGDEESALAFIGFPGVLLTIFFIIASSIGMIMKKEPPLPAGGG